MKKNMVKMIILCNIIVIICCQFRSMANEVKMENNEDINNVIMNSIDEKENKNVFNNIVDDEKQLNSVDENELLENDVDKYDKNEEENVGKNNEENSKKQPNPQIDSCFNEEEKKQEKNIKTEEKSEKNVTQEVIYSTHIQNIGWQNNVHNGDLSGTEGKGLRMEALKINLSGFDGLSIEYQAHIQNIGWQNWKANGDISGTIGQGLRMEALRIRIKSSDEYSIMYRTHIQNIGWQDWKNDGDISGTVGQGLRIEAIQIKVISKVKKGIIKIEKPQNNISIYNKSNVEVLGWKMSNIKNTYVKLFLDNKELEEIKYYGRKDIVNSILGYGTVVENSEPGFKIMIDANELVEGQHSLKAELYTPDGELLSQNNRIFFIDNTLTVSYKSHIQDIGWQNEVKNGELSGTQGQSKRIEALQINLNNAPNGAKVLYKTHVQDIGWQSWKSNGELAGTEGRSKRIEAIQIKLENMDEYTIEYQVHIQDYGWSDWYIDGETAGTIGKSKRIEAIRIRIVKKYKRGYMGIDVSQYNGDINWANVKNSGIDFAMIRVGFRGWGQAGNFKEDANFKTNIQNAKAAGLKVGVYFVTQAKNDQESIQEANWVLDKIQNYHLDYPVALDIEASTAPNNTGRADNLDKNTRGRLARIFCQTIQNSGYVPMIYLNVDWAKNRVDMSQLTEYDTWIANYKHDLTLKPSYSGKYTIWQYTDIGRINGINTKVDVNISYKRYE